MRLDARKGDFGWTVWHCERCEVMHGVAWCDDETNELGIYREPMPPVMIEVVRVRKILIVPARRMVLVNPLEGVDELEAPADAIGRPVEEAQWQR